MGIWEKLLGGKKERIFAPMPGETVPLADVPDETFAKEILGKGIAIRPASGSSAPPAPDGWTWCLKRAMQSR